jgi:hypothetical protein
MLLQLLLELAVMKVEMPHKLQEVRKIKMLLLHN